MGLSCDGHCTSLCNSLPLYNRLHNRQSCDRLYLNNVLRRQRQRFSHIPAAFCICLVRCVVRQDLKKNGKQKSALYPRSPGCTCSRHSLCCIRSINKCIFNGFLQLYELRICFPRCVQNARKFELHTPLCSSAVCACGSDQKTRIFR